MRVRRVVQPLVAAGLLGLAACGPNGGDPAPTSVPSVSAPAPPDAPRSPAADPTSPEAAADVVRAYYRDLNRRAFESAFERWGPDGPPDQTYDAFVTGFAETA